LISSDQALAGKRKTIPIHNETKLIGPSHSTVSLSEDIGYSGYRRGATRKQPTPSLSNGHDIITGTLRHSSSSAPWPMPKLSLMAIADPPCGRVSVVVSFPNCCCHSLLAVTPTKRVLRTSNNSPTSISQLPPLTSPDLLFLNTHKPMSFTLTRRALQSTTRTTALKLNLRTMSSNPAISNPAKSETENRGPQFGFAERQPEQEEKKVMDDILNLCKCRPRHISLLSLFSPPSTSLCG